MEDWAAELQRGRPGAACDLFLGRYRRLIFEHVFLDQRSHVEAYELIRAREAPALSFREFLEELRATYRAVTDGRRGRLLRELGSRVVEQEAVPEPTGPSASDAVEQTRII